MSLVTIKNFFKSEMVSLGFTEHKDGFAFNNIPRSNIDRAFHVELNNVTQDAIVYPSVQLSVPVTVRVFKRGYLDAVAALDTSHGYGDTIVSHFLEASVAQTHPIKGLSLASMVFSPQNVENDNSVLTEIVFDVGFYLCLEGL